MRVLLVLCLSGVQWRAVNIAPPDPIGVTLLWVVSFTIFLLSGTQGRIVLLYLVLALPAALSLFSSWILFNPLPGRLLLPELPVYSGQLWIGLALWQLVLIACIAGSFLWTRRLAPGILVGIVLAFLCARFIATPAWTLAQLPFFHPLVITVSEQGLLLALTKVIGYSGMAFATASLVLTGRDIELIGAMRQLRLPPPIVFFISTVFRSLDMTLADYQTIRQAQMARAINARPRSFLQRLRDLAQVAVPMVATMIRRSSEMGDALVARGYQLQKPNSDFYETQPFRLIDAVLLLVCCMLVYFTFGPRLNLTALLVQWI